MRRKEIDSLNSKNPKRNARWQGAKRRSASPSVQTEINPGKLLWSSETERFPWKGISFYSSGPRSGKISWNRKESGEDPHPLKEKGELYPNPMLARRGAKEAVEGEGRSELTCSLTSKKREERRPRVRMLSLIVIYKYWPRRRRKEYCEAQSPIIRGPDDYPLGNLRRLDCKEK